MKKEEIKEYIKNNGDIKLLVANYPNDLILISKCLIEVIKEEDNKFNEILALETKENKIKSK